MFLAIRPSCYDLSADTRSCCVAGHVHSYERSNPVWAQALPLSPRPSPILPGRWYLAETAPAHECGAAGSRAFLPALCSHTVSCMLSSAAALRLPAFCCSVWRRCGIAELSVLCPSAGRANNYIAASVAVRNGMLSACAVMCAQVYNYVNNPCGMVHIVVRQAARPMHVHTFELTGAVRKGYDGQGMHAQHLLHTKHARRF